MAYSFLDNVARVSCITSGLASGKGRASPCDRRVAKLGDFPWRCFLVKIPLSRQGLTYLVQMAVFIFLCWVAGAPVPVGAAPPQADVYVFWQIGCPHCAREKDFLDRLAAEEPRIHIHALEISGNTVHREAFQAIVRRAGIDKPGIPLTVIGETVLEGYNDDSTTGAAIRAGALDCLKLRCRDLVQPLLGGHRASADGLPLQVFNQGARIIKLPVFGEVQIGQVSLPVLTILLGAVDGFNPCAMWTLLFLISLLVGLRDRFRMWVLGGAFILASAAVYYLFMAA